MFKLIDRWINGFTMYQLTLWGLLAIAFSAVALSFAGVLPYGGFSLLFSLFFSFAVCEGSNRLLAKIFHASPSVESATITSLILFLILPPVTSVLGGAILLLAGIAGIASKYLFTFRGQHIFNPAAFGAAYIGFVGLGGALWWVGATPLFPIILIVSVLMAHKIRHISLFLWGVFASILTVFSLRVLEAGSPLPPEESLSLLWQLLSSWPILFLCGVMLTEPATTPPKKSAQALYGIFVGFLSVSGIHFGSLYTTPELSLLVGNLLFFALFPKERLLLTLKEKIPVAKDLYHFVFEADRPFSFAPGQYLEWTLPHAKADDRGNRRYFTIASAPTEKDLAIGVKIQENCSSFKKALGALRPGEKIGAAQRSGDFILPKNPNKKLVFIAGGIGITPFRSMVEELLLTEKTRDIALFYAVTTQEELAYQDVWLEASARMPFKFIPLVNQYLNEEIIRAEIPHLKDCLFYLSGPHAMVETYRTLLKKVGVPSRAIKTDYFPGF